MAAASNANTFLEEYESYAKPENQEPQGPARRRKRSNAVLPPELDASGQVV